MCAQVSAELPISCEMACHAAQRCSNHSSRLKFAPTKRQALTKLETISASMANWVFRVLGQFEVVGPNGPMRMRSARERTILARLVLNANHLVVTERLIDAVWPESPPVTARDQIYTCICRLRKALADVGLVDRLITRHPGYLLTIRNGELDLDAFEQQVKVCMAAVDNTAVTREGLMEMRNALQLFSGDPFVNVASQTIQSAAQRILERKMLLAERCIAAELQLNMYNEALADLAELVSEHPLQERLRVLQMTALHRAGRRVEALALYEETRRELIDQLGVEPCAELRAAHMSVLSDRGEPCISSSTVQRKLATRLFPPELQDFNARTQELSQVCKQVLTWTAAGRGGLVAISGQAGVGKTAFARLLTSELTDYFENGQLYAELVDEKAQPVSSTQVLESFLRALGMGRDSIPQNPGERAEVYQSLIAGRRLLILLDGATAEKQVWPLLPGNSTSLVVVTSRARLGGLIGALHVHLDLPDVDAGVRMLETMIGRDRVAAEPMQTRTLVQQCGRLPYALRFAAARLNSRPHWTIDQMTERLADECHRLDELSYRDRGVRESIMESYDALDPIAQRLFDHLPLCPAPNFPAWVCAPLLDSDPDYALEALERLVDIQLVEVSRDIVDYRYQVGDLVMLVARERMALHGPGERNAAQRRLIATCLYLIDEVNSSERRKILGLTGASATRRPLPRHWVRRLMPNPLTWMDRELPIIETAVRHAIEIGAGDMCWDLAVGVAVFRTNQHLAVFRTS